MTTAILTAGEISIHAPARGATNRKYSKLENILDFNPRSRTGSDKGKCERCGYEENFNPRSRTGSDTSLSSRAMTFSRFQSTLPHGERRVYQRGKGTLQIFQSTLPHGERLPLSETAKGRIWISIHAPARGATACSICC